MAGAPDWKVYDAMNQYQAACKEPTAAVVLADEFYGLDATVRYGHNKRNTVWIAGEERYDSYDELTERLEARARTFHYHYTGERFNAWKPIDER